MNLTGDDCERGNEQTRKILLDSSSQQEDVLSSRSRLPRAERSLEATESRTAPISLGWEQEGCQVHILLRVLKVAH